MSKITEQFVPYKQAKELKELGFKFDFTDYNLSPYAKYVEGYPEEGLRGVWLDENTPSQGYIYAPLYSQAFDWFREKYNLNPWIDCNSDKKWLWTINFIEVGDYIQSDDWLEELENLPDSYETFQEAQLACLDKLIELVNEK